MSDEKKNNKLIDNLFKIPIFKKLKSVKHIEIIICIIFISLLLLIYFYGFNDKKTTKETIADNEFGEVSFKTASEYSKEVENKITTIVSSLKGVSSASVMVSVCSGGEIVIANSIEETKEENKDGESKNVTTIKTPIIVTENGTSKPVVLMEILPKIQGVIVVAKGADDVNVKLNIYKAIQTITELPSENIQVFAGK